MQPTWSSHFLGKGHMESRAVPLPLHALGSARASEGPRTEGWGVAITGQRNKRYVERV